MDNTLLVNVKEVNGLPELSALIDSTSGKGRENIVLAGGISRALAHTMLGLLLAVPCLAAFGVLRTIVDRLTTQGALIAEELLLMIKPAEAKPISPGVGPMAGVGGVGGAIPPPPPRPASGLPTPAPATMR